MSFTYTTGIPNPPNDPSQDVSGMQTNTNSISSWVDVDHVGFNNSLGGKHLQVTIPAPQVAPTVTGAVGVVSTQALANTELFFTNATKNVQITNSSLTASSGQGMLPGGLQIRAGTGASTSLGNPISISPPFPNGFISVVACNKDTTNHNTGYIITTNIDSNSQFTAYSTVGAINIYYIAVGY